jgi:O-antigen/teichoic acid export membrane protein
MIKKIVATYNSGAANRAALNTLVIYFQRFFAAGLSLITTPLILKALGVESYGIYTLTIGFVGMLAVLNWSLSNATQRYTAFAIGEGDFVKLKKVFSTALLIHFLYGLLLFSIIAVIGYFFVENILNIPVGKVEDAKTVLYIVAFLSFITIMTIPFLGILRTNENFLAIAVIGIIESVLKLGIALLILNFISSKLVVYSVLLMGISFLSLLIYIGIVKAKYKMVKVTFGLFDRKHAKDMFSFLSWSLLGSLALTSRNEGVQVLINIFFGVVRNAAYGIATQISVAMSILAQGIIGSITPQIIKSAGSGEIAKMIFLMRTMSKFAAFSISIVVIPIFFECDTLLKLWLTNVPADTVMYVRLIIIFGQIMLFSAGIQTVFDALGKVKIYNIWVSIILILNLPVAYIFFKLGFPSYTIIIIGMVLELVSLNVRLRLLRKYVDFSIKEFYIDTIFRVCLPTIVVSCIVYASGFLNLNPFLNLVLAFLISFTLYPIVIYNFSLEARQKELLLGIINKFIKTKKAV